MAKRKQPAILIVEKQQNKSNAKQARHPTKTTDA
jgi:hypothetical protein